MTRPRRAAAVLGVLALVVTAGCGAVGGVDRPTYDVPARTTTTATTATATAAPNETGPELAPGLGPEGVRDPAALVGAHARVLADRSFRARHDRTVRYPNGTVVHARTVTVARAGNGSRYRLDLDLQPWPLFVSDRIGVSLFSAGADRPVFERRVRTPGGGPEYRVVPGAGGDARAGSALAAQVLDPRFDDRVYGLLSAVRAADVEPLGNGSAGDGPRRYRVLARSVRSAAVPTPAYLGTDPRNVSLRAVVDERGVVRRVRVRYRVGYRDGTVTVVESVRVGGVGRTTVRTPDWVGAARNATNVTNVTNATDGGDRGTNATDRNATVRNPTGDGTGDRGTNATDGDGPATNATARNEGTATVDGPIDDGPIDDGPSDDEPVGDGPTADEPVGDGPTADGPSDDGPIDDGPTADPGRVHAGPGRSRAGARPPRGRATAAPGAGPRGERGG